MNSVKTPRYSSGAYYNHSALEIICNTNIYVFHICQEIFQPQWHYLDLITSLKFAEYDFSLARIVRNVRFH